MSLPRKAVHLKLDPDVHAQLLDLCAEDKILPAHWVEQLVENALAREFTRAASLRRKHEARISSAKSRYARLSQTDDLLGNDIDKL